MATATRGKLIRAADVAAIIGVSPRQAAQLMTQMPRINVGKSMVNPRWAVYEADVQEWLQRRMMPADEPHGQRRTRKHTTTIARMDGLLDANGHIPRRR